MTVRHPLRLLAAAALVAAAACGGHSSGGGGGGTPQGPNGGTVTLQYSASSPYAMAVFVSSSGDFTPVPNDGCLAMSTAGTPVGTRFLDGGATLTFTGGGKTITLDRFGDPTYMYYAASPTPGQVALDTTYDGALAGGPDIPATTWPAVITLRHPISLGATLPVPASGDLALSWTSAGADFVRIDFYAGFTPPALFSCWAKDDGHFSVPASFLATLPTGSGGVLAAATKRNTVLVGGRVVAFDGEASSGATWTK